MKLLLEALNSWESTFIKMAKATELEWPWGITKRAKDHLWKGSGVPLESSLHWMGWGEHPWEIQRATPLATLGHHWKVYGVNQWMSWEGHIKLYGYLILEEPRDHQWKSRGTSLKESRATLIGLRFGHQLVIYCLRRNHSKPYFIKCMWERLLKYPEQKALCWSGLDQVLHSQIQNIQISYLTFCKKFLTEHTT